MKWVFLILKILISPVKWVFLNVKKFKNTHFTGEMSIFTVEKIKNAHVTGEMGICNEICTLFDYFLNFANVSIDSATYRLNA